MIQNLFSLGVVLNVCRLYEKDTVGACDALIYHCLLASRIIFLPSPSPQNAF